MRGRTLLTLIFLVVGSSSAAMAQDVPGIEICTVEKTMERRTSCLQSNVNFLQQTVGKLRLDQQQRLDAANRQIDALRATVTNLQKTVEELQVAQKAAAASPVKGAPAPAKDATPAAKDAAPPAKDAAK
jgi:TolA-binding protein